MHFLSKKTPNSSVNKKYLIFNTRFTEHEKVLDALVNGSMSFSVVNLNYEGSESKEFLVSHNHSKSPDFILQVLPALYNSVEGAIEAIKDYNSKAGTNILFQPQILALSNVKESVISLTFFNGLNKQSAHCLYSYDFKNDELSVAPEKTSPPCCIL